MSCPGLSVRGKEGESVTPQERAEAKIDLSGQFKDTTYYG